VNRVPSPLMPTYAPAEVTFVRGKGCELFDDAGRRYLDFLAGIAVVSLGHAHPAVTRALTEQAGTLLHVSNLFRTTVGEEVARLLDELIGDGQPAGGQVFFCNSGAEANEAAIKLARRARPGRPVVVSAQGSFHGRTLGALAATGQPEKQAPFAPLPGGFRQVPYDDLVGLEQALADGQVGAVLLEAIQGEAGVIEPRPGYLREVAARCQAAGALLILDEVQTGLARTGRWFAFHHEGIQPDIVTVAKALGNGVPIGACWARAEVAQAFRPGDHGTTFGGQPLAASAARATLQTMRELDAPVLAAEAGQRLKAGLARLPGVREVRGRGLLLGVGLQEPWAKEAVGAALRAGLVCNAPRADTIRLAPPLVVSEAEVDEALGLLGEALERGGRAR
jgi:acetylornithine/N-succinyldiaminopimelate aminotransferase